jgi:hypothetical protein
MDVVALLFRKRSSFSRKKKQNGEGGVKFDEKEADSFLIFECKE